VSVGVGEESGLENGISGRLNTLDEVRRREGDLLDFGEVVLDVFVEGELSDGSERELLLRPGLGQVEDVVTELLGLLGSHDLDVEGPRRELSLLDRFEEILVREVGVLSGHLSSFLVREGLDTLVGLVVELDVDERTVLLDELVGVSRVTIHESVSVRRSSTVGEENGELMERFRVLRGVVPEVVGILQVSLGITLLSVNEVRELHRVAEEEDGSVVVNLVPVSVLGTKLDGETTRVTGGIGRSTLTSNSRESSGADLGTDFGEELGAGEVRDVVSNFEGTVSSSSLSVNDTFGNTFAIKVCESIDQVEVLKEERSLLASALDTIR